MNTFRFGIKLSKAKITGKYIPFQVVLNVTDRCNLKCRYCFGSYGERGMEDLSIKDIFKIIDELHKLGTERITLSGGEPLLRKDIGQIIKYIKSKHMDCCISTNGYFVPEKIDDLKFVDYLLISLDGNKESNDINRGNGCFDRAIRAIEVARDNHIPVQIAVTITRDNLQDINFIIVISKKYKCTVGFRGLLKQKKWDGGGKLSCENIPSDEEYRRVIKQIIKKKKEGAPFFYSTKSLEYFLRWPFGYEIDRVKNNIDMLGFRPFTCYGGKYFILIDVNGDVYPCCVLVGDYSPPNCLKIGLQKALEIISNHNCRACHFTHNNELNLLFSLDVSVIMNILKNY